MNEDGVISLPNMPILSEEKIIRILWKHVGHGKNKVDPFSDDASWNPLDSRKKFLVAKSDMFVSSTDAPPKMTPRQMATKSVTACVSDLASKGVRPQYCLISIAIPRNKAHNSFVNSLGTGFSEASKLYGVRIVGGDTSSSASDVILNCSVYGFSDRIVRRKGAKVGDLVGVTGAFGLQSAGLLVSLGKAKSRDKNFERNAINSVLNPRARLETGLKLAKFLSSSIDSSDGLAISLHYLAESSNVSIIMDSIPLSEGVGRFADENSIADPSTLALFGGEEYEIVATYPAASKNAVERLGVITIGRAVKTLGKPDVFYQGKRIQKKGWMHFVSSD